MELKYETLCEGYSQKIIKKNQPQRFSKKQIIAQH
jgi:hypothetical protein